MRRLALLLLLLVAAPAWADGTFCWDPVPGAVFYNLYSLEVQAEWVVTDPDTGDGYCTTAAPRWSACTRQTFSHDNCAANRCCVFVVDKPADVVFYFVAPVDAAGRETLTRPMEACP